jgi:dTDP-4-amino-4,6-dideoxygalactose transaminase
MILFEDRAATVLYEVLKKLPHPKKFLLPLNVCPIVPDTFIKANIKFDFIDINVNTLCMDFDLIFDKIKNDQEVDGILFVKTFGIDLDTTDLYQQIKSINQNIFIIDDCCPCIQNFNYDIKSSYADMALFSSGYSKYVDIGYGGYGFLKDNKFNHIFINKNKDPDFLEYKVKIQTDIQQMNKHKATLNTIYQSNLPKEIQLGDKFNTWRFSILVDNKEEILKKIFEIDGLFASSHYPQVDFDYSSHPIKNSNTQKVHTKIINLFNDFRFTEEKAYKVVDIINRNLLQTHHKV